MELRIEKRIGNQWYTIICYEAKKAKCTQTEIDELEYQAYNACITHLNYTGRDQMYAITTIGTTARLWYITKTDDYLLPFVPVDTALAERSAYIEAHSTDAQQLRDGFNYVKENDNVSSKRLKVLRSNCSPRTFAAAAFMGGRLGVVRLILLVCLQFNSHMAPIKNLWSRWIRSHQNSLIHIAPLRSVAPIQLHSLEVQTPPWLKLQRLKMRKWTTMILSQYPLLVRTLLTSR